MNVYVKNVYKGSCHPQNISYASPGEDPSWISCGVFDTPSSDPFDVRIYARGEIANSRKYNGTYFIWYKIYARLTMSCDGADYFAIAPTCPIPNKMSAVRGCNDAACGEYCLADGVLPDGNKNYIINNCISGGQNQSVFIRLCTGQPTTEAEIWVQERHRVFGEIRELHF
jgi:hypothetical protein